MPKTVQFDEQQILKNLRFLFREKGYNGTTLKDLCKTTKLNPGSLYNSFGNKDQLFILALESYNEIAINRRIEKYLNTEIGSPFSGLKKFVSSTFIEEEKIKIGCLVTNSASEIDVLPKKCYRVVEKGLELLEKGFFNYLQSEVQINHIKLRLDTQKSARLLLVQYQGFMTLVKLKKDDSYLTSYLKNIMIPILLDGENL